MYNESFIPSVGKSFYDAKKGSLGDPQKEFLNQTLKEAQGFGKRLPVPRFYELIEKVPFTVGYENGDPALTFTYVTTPYGVFPVQSGNKKPAKKEDLPQKKEEDPDNNKHNQNQDPKNDTPEQNKNNALVCIMQRRKNLHMVLFILLILIVIILLLKRN